MKKMSLLALLVGAALFTGLGATSVLAEEGKCGSEVKKPAEGKCGAQQNGKCGDNKAMTPGKCGAKKAMPAEGKCDSAKKEPVGKCGAGKCGSK